MKPACTFILAALALGQDHTKISQKKRPAPDDDNPQQKQCCIIYQQWLLPEK